MCSFMPLASSCCGEALRVQICCDLHTDLLTGIVVWHKQWVSRKDSLMAA